MNRWALAAQRTVLQTANCKLVTLFSTALDFFLSFFIKKKRKNIEEQRLG